jgi:hypothetical protein
MLSFLEDFGSEVALHMQELKDAKAKVVNLWTTFWNLFPKELYPIILLYCFPRDPFALSETQGYRVILSNLSLVCKVWAEITLSTYWHFGKLYVFSLFVVLF